MKRIPLKDNKYYYATTDGRIISFRVTHEGSELKQQNDGNGYLMVSLHGKSFKVHRLIALTYLPNPDGKPEVNHVNGLKRDNQAHNLEWCTRSENMLHAMKRGLGLSGERNNLSKLTKEKVLEIRDRIWRGEKGIDLAKEFGVRPEAISKIKLRKSWKHI